MHRMCGKLTYSNVVSTLCLILLVGGGTAYAAAEMLPKGSVGTKQLRKEAVTPAKLSKSSKATLSGPAGKKGATGATGPQGPRGDTGPQGTPGAAGSAVAYARIEADGTLDVAHSKSIESARRATNGGSPVTGVFCIKPSVPVASAVASVPHAFADEGVFAEVSLVTNGDEASNFCPGEDWISTWHGTTLVNHAVYVLFN